MLVDAGVVHEQDHVLRLESGLPPDLPEGLVKEVLEHGGVDLALDGLVADDPRL